jgi:hypothetical protein
MVTLFGVGVAVKIPQLPVVVPGVCIVGNVIEVQNGFPQRHVFICFFIRDFFDQGGNNQRPAIKGF